MFPNALCGKWARVWVLWAELGLIRLLCAGLKQLGIDLSFFFSNKSDFLLS
jgi:hypothetical protein